MSTPVENRNGSATGYLAKRAFLPGDPLPKTGSLCLVSGANCDIDCDQHRGYVWCQVLGFSDDDMFVCLQKPDCWPNAERTENCWFAEIPEPRSTTGSAS